MYCATGTLSEIWPKNVVWTWKHGPQLPIYIKVTIPKNSADAGGSAKKSQECSKYQPISTLKESWPMHWYLYSFIISEACVLRKRNSISQEIWHKLNIFLDKLFTVQQLE
jgi:hypothetical protein